MANRSMKDSGVEWIGEMPVGWEYKPLKYVAKIQTGNTPSMKNKHYYSNIGTEWVKTNNLLGTNGVSESDTKLSEEGIKQGKIAKANSILVSCIGDVGKMGFIEVDSTFNQQINAITFDDNEVYWKYGMYFISTQQDQHRYYQNGNVLKILNTENHKKVIVPIPNLNEQQKIASFLDGKVAHIDSILEDTKKSIEYLKSYKQSLITETVTKGLNANVEMKDSGIEWIGEIPKHWQTVKMKRLGYVRNGLTYKPSDIVDSSEGIMVLRSGNIQDSRLSFENNVYVNKEIKDELKVNAGDILICSRNGSRNLIGKNALIENDLEATFGAFMMLFKPIANSSYIYYILNSEVFNFYLGTFLTTTINQLTKSNFESMIVVFTPDEKEQLEIASYLKKNVENLNSIIDEKNKILMELKAYKKSLIYEYVTGKKEVQ